MPGKSQPKPWTPRLGMPVTHGGQTYTVTGIWTEQQDGEPENVTIKAVVAVPHKRVYGFRP